MRRVPSSTTELAGPAVSAADPVRFWLVGPIRSQGSAGTLDENAMVVLERVA